MTQSTPPTSTLSAAVVFKLRGRALARPEVPALLRAATRGAPGGVGGVGGDEAESRFLPEGLLQATASLDLSAGLRGGPAGEAAELKGEAGQVLVIELADGGTLVTSPGRLKSALLRKRPDLVDASGAVLFERMSAEGAAMQRGSSPGFVGGMVSRVTTLAVGADSLIEEARARFATLSGGPADAALEPVSWLATKALMEVVEDRLQRPPGHLYRWTDSGTPLEAGAPDDCARMFDANGRAQAALVFIHGTGSNTIGSFGDLQRGDRALWSGLEQRFPGGIYGFEHRTLSQSPIDNALQLASALPAGAHVCLVTHSRGGLVGDLLCAQDLDRHVDAYRYAFPGVGDVDGHGPEVRAQLDEAHAAQRRTLGDLFAKLRERSLVIERYVRVASPAQGTRLASGNFDVFLSGLLSLIGRVPGFFGNPLYAAFKRVVIEIAKNRTNPHLVPGIEAMLPDSPMAALLRNVAVQQDLRMALIAGDMQGGNLLMRMGMLLTDFLLFENTDNDLVVDTASMLAGVARRSGAHVLFDRGSDVSHFNYFANTGTRSALRDWLVQEQPDQLEAFRALPAQFTSLDAAGIAATRGAAEVQNLPVVVVLPGIMGTYLDADGKRVWLDPITLAAGGLSSIAFGADSVTAGGLFAKAYGEICEQLAGSHRVLPFPYDWRQPLDVLGERLGAFLDVQLQQTTQPVRLLAHSMGGLVVRACILRRRDVMDALMRRDGARLVMAGTPHQGSHSMVENLLGKGDSLRSLAVLDVRHSLQQVLDIVAGYRGALQLLPRTGFVDTFEGQPDGGERHDYWSPDTWKTLRDQNTDLWFGDHCCGLPDAGTLASAGWLWAQDASAPGAGPDGTPALPAEYASRSVYVFGVAPNTPCGLRLDSSDGAHPRLRMVSTTRGDGTVTWDSGRIGGIGSFYWLPAVHGDLLSTKDCFGAFADLLQSGATTALDRSPPATRAIGAERPVSYDPGPPSAADDATLTAAVLGGRATSQVAPQAKTRLDVRMQAMDLRFLTSPILVGHYENDTMAGTEALVDAELMDGQLAQRKMLDLYAGPLGTASVVLRAPSAIDRRRGVLTGAIVTGLGPYEGNLSQDALMLAVRAGVLRFLLQVVDVMGREDREVPLATLLLGYNSSASLSIAASVEALVRGVIEANDRFKRVTGLAVRVSRLDIVELYLDTAISAVYELRQLAPRLQAVAVQKDTLLQCSDELVQGLGVRQRLLDTRGANYWPRLIVTDADDPGTGPRPAGPTRLADRLRFLYVGQRARAETVVQQRQPGLIEQLVRQQISQTQWNADFGRMLFQLIVPPNFKDAARQLQRIVLVVDAATANMPWELMLTDPLFTPEAQRDGPLLPLSLCTPVVRQLASTTFRQDVRQSVAKRAYVVGNPSVRGFAKAFPDEAFTGKADAQQRDPDPLPNAEAEADAIAALLSTMGYEVSRAIGTDSLASDVLAKLYRSAYRALHISGHGVFDQLHVDGLRRSGVVLSDGLLITAAEIEAMESVPELVFLNCCHLGEVDAGAEAGPTVRDGNRLAASVARELMAIGVRCVVVAGWAVDDKLARLFGEVFYKALFDERMHFGDAVFRARNALWQENPDNVTWGAFQAYGDPLWLAAPEADGASAAARGAPPFASLDEMLDELARTRVEASRRSERQLDAERQARIDAIEEACTRRCPPAWLRLPALQSALGATWHDLGCLGKAREALIAAVQSVDAEGHVPIHDIELLASVEAELGLECAVQDVARIRAARQGGTPRMPRPVPHGLALIRRGIDRLVLLDRLVSKPGLNAPGTAAPMNVERFAQLAMARKRKAAVYALNLLRLSPDADRKSRWFKAMTRATLASLQAYERAQEQPADEGFRPYDALNALALSVALDGWEAPARVSAAVAMARQCGEAVSRLYAQSGDPWDLVISPESLLVERLCDGSIAMAGDAGTAAVNEVLEVGRTAAQNIGLNARHIERTVVHMELLELLFRARAAMGCGDGYVRMADGLAAVIDRLQPGHDAFGLSSATTTPAG